jgi:ATP-dependent DNA ligase
MNLKLKPPLAPMEARLVDEIPAGPDWQYEPKWDGFRCIAFRDGKEVYLQSKSGQPLSRYFPDVAKTLLDLKPAQFVLDGELVIPIGDALSFNDLLLRIHPAASRVAKLVREHPALFIAFDLLADTAGKPLLKLPLCQRHEKLQEFAARYFKGRIGLRLSPATDDIDTARKWFKSIGASLDGVIAKRTDFDYRSADRTGMVKVKAARTADCVVGGFRYASKGKAIGSMLLGLYDDEGRLHHVGFCSSLSASERQALKPKLEKLIKPPGFTGHAPGGPSRWSTARSAEWQPLAPKLVVEVAFDHVTAGRFRHGTRFCRWRPDKAPQQCTMEQIENVGKGSLALLSSE